MKVNIQLLRDLENRLNELGALVTAREYSQEAIAKKINGIEKGLRKLNATSRAQLQAYRQQNIEWQRKLQDHSAVLDGYVGGFQEHIDQLIATTDQMIADQRAGLPVKASDLPLADPDPEEILTAFAAVGAELSNIDGLLAEDLHIRFSRGRRWIARIGWVFFRFNNITARLMSITCTISIAYAAELLLDQYLENWPKYFITLVIALVSGFSFDLLIEKYATRYFWHNAECWALVLAKQMKLATDQILSVQNFEIQKN